MNPAGTPPDEADRMEEKRFRRRLWLIVGAAFLLRILCALPAFADPEMLLRPDSGGYFLPAEALLADGAYLDAPGAGTPATLRPPGYSLVLALTFLFCGKSFAAAGLFGCLLGALSCYPVGLCGRILGGRNAGLAAAALLALNLSALANAPLILADILLGFLCAWQCFFLLKAWRTRALRFWLGGLLVSALGALCKPVNLPLFLLAMPVLAMLFFGFRKKMLRAVVCWGGVFLLLLFPWMFRNFRLGAGFALDSNSADLYFHNGSAILASATGENSAVILERLKNETQHLFDSDPARFPDTQAKSSYKKASYLALMKRYPAATLKTHLPQPFMLLPDLPVFLENNGLTRHGRGTLGVLRREGLFAALDHYLGGRYALILPALPLLFASGMLYLLSAWELLLWLRHWKWRLLMLTGALVFYYLAAPGPVTMPRYQIPALPMLCTMGGAAFALLLRRAERDGFRKKKRPGKKETSGTIEYAEGKAEH